MDCDDGIHISVTHISYFLLIGLFTRKFARNTALFRRTEIKIYVSKINLHPTNFEVSFFHIGMKSMTILLNIFNGPKCSKSKTFSIQEFTLFDPLCDVVEFMFA